MKSENYRRVAIGAGMLSAAMSGLLIVAPMAGAQQKPFELGVSETGTGTQQVGGYEYPAPQLVQPQRPMNASIQQNQAPPMRASIQQNQAPPRRAPIQASVQRQVALPPGFLGDWKVHGQRQKVESTPQLQQRFENAYPMTTDDTWRIAGNPGSGYTMSNPGQGVSMPFMVDHVEGGTAYVRYQHQVINVVAQEAVVLSLVPGGIQFNGLERITIVKPGEPPRAKITYQLIGHRQR